MKTLALRLHPGSDPKASLLRLCLEHEIRAGIVLTCVGSLRRVALRYANREETTILTGHYEILALSGTLSPDGLHLHLSIANGDGRTFGGHLMDGSEVYTTAEIVVGVLEHITFSRSLDPETGYPESVILER